MSAWHLRRKGVFGWLSWGLSNGYVYILAERVTNGHGAAFNGSDILWQYQYSTEKIKAHEVSWRQKIRDTSLLKDLEI